MPSIIHSVQIDAPAERIFPLVSTADGLSQWWAADVTEPGKGTIELGFFNRATIYTLQAARIAAPNDAEMLVAHAENLVRLGKYAEAVAVFDKATRIEPANSNGWSGLAFAASKINQPVVTLHALFMRSKLLPENASTYFLWATSYDTLHQKAQAVAFYHHFLEAAGGKFPNQEWQARQRLQLLEK